MSYELLVVSFPGERKADEVLTALRALESEATVDLESSAVIVRRENDNVSIRESRDYDAKQGALVGAAGGLLLGALFGGGALKGALIGAGAGAVTGKFIDMGLDDDFLKGVGDQLSQGHSAIVALVDFTHLERAMEELDRFQGGTILHHELGDDAYQKLSDAVED